MIWPRCDVFLYGFPSFVSLQSIIKYYIIYASKDKSACNNFPNLLLFTFCPAWRRFPKIRRSRSVWWEKRQSFCDNGTQVSNLSGSVIISINVTETRRSPWDEPGLWFTRLVLRRAGSFYAIIPRAGQHILSISYYGMLLFQQALQPQPPPQLPQPPQLLPQPPQPPPQPQLLPQPPKLPPPQQQHSTMIMIMIHRQPPPPKPPKPQPLLHPNEILLLYSVKCFYSPWKSAILLTLNNLQKSSP